MSHIEKTTLELYVLDAKEVADQRIEIARHLKDCPGCLALFNQISEYYAEVDRLLDEQEQEHPLLVSRRWLGQAKQTTTPLVASKVENALPVRLARLVVLHPVVSSAFGLAAALFIAFLLIFPRKGLDDTNPSYARAKDEFLIVYNKEGGELWRKQIGIDYDQEKLRHMEMAYEPSDYLATVDVDGDGKNEVIGSFGMIGASPLVNAVVAFNADGTERWRYPFHRQMVFGTQAFADVYFFHRLISGDFDNNGKPEIIAMAIQGGYYPTCIVKLSSIDGTLLGEYWSPGNLLSSDYRDIDGDGYKDLVLAGQNNGYDMASLIVLDPRTISGHSPAPQDFTPKNVPAGTEKYYLLFPRSDLKEVSTFKRNRAFITMRGGPHLAINVSEKVDSLWYSIIYHFDDHLRCTGVDGEDSFVGVHQRLEKESRLTKHLGASYYEDLQRSILYWDGDKFVHEPTMNRRYKETLKTSH